VQIASSRIEAGKAKSLANAGYGARYASTTWAKNTLALNKPRIAAIVSIILRHLVTLILGSIW
jgi:hypothetical protein